MTKWFLKASFVAILTLGIKPSFTALASGPFFKNCGQALQNLASNPLDLIHQIDAAYAQLPQFQRSGYDVLALNLSDTLLHPSKQDHETANTLFSTILDYVREGRAAPVPKNIDGWSKENKLQIEALALGFDPKKSQIFPQAQKFIIPRYFRVAENFEGVKLTPSKASTAEMPIFEFPVQTPGNGFKILNQIFVPLLDETGRLNLRAYDLYRRSIAAAIIGENLDAPGPLYSPMVLATVNAQPGVVSLEFQYLDAHYNKRGELIHTQAEFLKAVESGLSAYAVQLAEVLSFLTANETSPLTHFIAFHDQVQSYDRLILTGLGNSFGPWMTDQSEAHVLGDNIPTLELPSGMKRELTQLEPTLEKIFLGLLTQNEIEALRFRIKLLLKADQLRREQLPAAEPNYQNLLADVFETPWVPKHEMRDRETWSAWLASGGFNLVRKSRNKIIYITLAIREPLSADMIAGFSGESEATVVQVLEQWTGMINMSQSPDGKRLYSLSNETLRRFLSDPATEKIAGFSLREAHAEIANSILKKIGL